MGYLNRATNTARHSTGEDRSYKKTTQTVSLMSHDHATYQPDTT